jgi:hypothetical protein
MPVRKLILFQDPWDAKNKKKAEWKTFRQSYKNTKLMWLTTRGYVHRVAADFTIMDK